MFDLLDTHSPLVAFRYAEAQLPSRPEGERGILSRKGSARSFYYYYIYNIIINVIPK